MSKTVVLMKIGDEMKVLFEQSDEWPIDENATFEHDGHLVFCCGSGQFSDRWFAVRLQLKQNVLWRPFDFFYFGSFFIPIRLC